MVGEGGGEGGGVGGRGDGQLCVSQARVVASVLSPLEGGHTAGAATPVPLDKQVGEREGGVGGVISMQFCRFNRVHALAGGCRACRVGKVGAILPL